jgi:hypothetical protein
MLVRLSISRWYGFARDIERSKDVENSAQAERGSASVNKRLLPKSALKEVNAALNAVRTHFYDSTLPWHDQGDRVLTRKMYMDFVEQHEALKAKAEEAIEKFVTDTYPRELDRAEFRMGDMFDPSDYPTPDALRRKYAIKLDFDVVSDSSDFRVNMDQAHAERIRSDIEANVQKRINGAMQDVWDRLATTLTHFHDRMADTDAAFKRNTVDNLQEIVDVLPKLNLTDDPDLEALRQDIQQHLTGLDPAELRKDTEQRQAVATEASRIMDTMKGFMAATGGQDDG